MQGGAGSPGTRGADRTGDSRAPAAGRHKRRLSARLRPAWQQPPRCLSPSLCFCAPSWFFLVSGVAREASRVRPRCPGSRPAAPEGAEGARELSHGGAAVAQQGLDGAHPGSAGLSPRNAHQGDLRVGVGIAPAGRAPRPSCDRRARRQAPIGMRAAPVRSAAPRPASAPRLAPPGTQRTPQHPPVLMME